MTYAGNFRCGGAGGANYRINYQFKFSCDALQYEIYEHFPPYKNYPLYDTRYTIPLYDTYNNRGSNRGS